MGRSPVLSSIQHLAGQWRPGYGNQSHTCFRSAPGRTLKNAEDTNALLSSDNSVMGVALDLPSPISARSSSLLSGHWRGGRLSMPSLQPSQPIGLKVSEVWQKHLDGGASGALHLLSSLTISLLPELCQDLHVCRVFPSLMVPLSEGLDWFLPAKYKSLSELSEDWSGSLTTPHFLAWS